MPDPTGSCGFPLAARKGEMSFLFRSEVTFYCPSALTLLQLTLPIQERSLSRHRKGASAGTGEEPQPAQERSLSRHRRGASAAGDTLPYDPLRPKQFLGTGPCGRALIFSCYQYPVRHEGGFRLKPGLVKPVTDKNPDILK